MFMDLVNSIALKVGGLFLQGARPRESDREFLENEIAKWRRSPQRLMQIKGFLYYDSEHDVLKRRRTMIGEDGRLQEVGNLPNNRIVDNQYAKMVNQKANYLFGQPFVLECANEEYLELLKKVFDKRFMKILKNSGKAIYNGGIAWLYPYYDEEGEFSFRLFPGYEVLPFWRDSEHTRLDCAVRLYPAARREGADSRIIEKVEVYDLQGVHRYILDGASLVPDGAGKDADSPHVTMTGADGAESGFNWLRVPLIPLKCNESETPLLKKVKSLQDGINAMLSDFQNNMQEDARNTILVIKNYDGTDLGEFRRNLTTFGAVKVRYDGEAKGGIETLEIEVSADNYKAVIELFKKALIENAMGYDAKDDRLGGNANRMNIQSMYSDIDIDANDTETEYQAAFDDMLWFVNAHLANTGQGDFDGEEAGVTFNRDILINEGEAIDSCNKSVDLSLETRLLNHPWVDNVEAELEKIKGQRRQEQEEMAAQYAPFSSSPGQGGQGGAHEE